MGRTTAPSARARRRGTRASTFCCMSARPCSRRHPKPLRRQVRTHRRRRRGRRPAPPPTGKFVPAAPARRRRRHRRAYFQERSRDEEGLRPRLRARVVRTSRASSPTTPHRLRPTCCASPSRRAKALVTRATSAAAPRRPGRWPLPRPAAGVLAEFNTSNPLGADSRPAVLAAPTSRRRCTRFRRRRPSRTRGLPPTRRTLRNEHVIGGGAEGLFDAEQGRASALSSA